MSFNIRYNNPDDKANWWEYRKQEVVEMINHYHPDFVGIQEGLVRQVQYLDSALHTYRFIGVGRDDGREKGEFAAIFYDTTRFDLIEKETFWLSQTPDTVSIGWDAALERICTFGAFRDKSTMDTLYLFNSHFDHMGKIAREKSAELVLSVIRQKGLDTQKIIVMGDFNSLPEERPVGILTSVLTDAYTASLLPPYGPAGTFNGFNPEAPVTQRIDYILVKNLAVKQFTTIDDRRKNNLWLSDHLPVMIQAE